jgi:hypothetical protein
LQNDRASAMLTANVEELDAQQDKLIRLKRNSFLQIKVRFS